ncbi:hypothetical protein [Flavobacterium reichenbachii]|uniref:Lipoprotein n=1 Tax=Flavobacterium reichenbachii TaxID=362418 RepID=A0A085ZP63_9FLAO|nr:hypothetical protein [Flavobacterium reichenbachii]KFF06227.1 hypothetical protein IW19_12100 [Flavobacterium reichenbachii]OXB17557.1 hypothetical protein B0A68_04480 [Flavobacterium reichenbachii]
MKNLSALLLLLTICMSCASSQNSMDGMVGKTKQNFIKTWGPAVRVLNNDQEGEILIYADQVYVKSENNSFEMAHSNYWNYTFVYVNKEGKIASYRKEKQVFPPQQISAGDLIKSNAISAK